VVVKVIIAGSRGITDPDVVDAAVDAMFAQPRWARQGWSALDIDEIVSGGARGVDALGEQWARQRRILVERFPVESSHWEKFGKIAGHLRNAMMAGYADAAICVWDGKSPGTRMMIDLMEWAGKPVYVHRVGDDGP
jgi:hypothetical protein